MTGSKKLVFPADWEDGKTVGIVGANERGRFVDEGAVGGRGSNDKSPAAER